MNKAIKIFLLSCLLIVIILTIATIVISFKVVKKTTDDINRDLNKKLQEIVRIPDIVPPVQKSYHSTTYVWEMVTPAKEVTAVRFTHETGFSKKQTKVNATLQMQPGSDPALFAKVLSAVVSDNQALSSAQDLEHTNLGRNDKIGYEKIELTRIGENSAQVSKIAWQFDRSTLVKNSQNLYSKLDKFPEPILKLLYLVQRSMLIVLSGS